MVTASIAVPFTREQIDAEKERRLCQGSFRHFLKYWRFKNRETGEILFFGDVLWQGQDGFVSMMEKYQWIIALKAGKLGFTELECAYDAWVALFGQANSRVHLFSKDLIASRELLKYIQFGLSKLPKEWKINFLSDKAGGLTATSLIFNSYWMKEDDERSVISYASTGNVAIDVSAQHNHVDELAHMQDGEGLWNSVETTVSPEGTCHIVSRGSGPGFMSTLWYKAVRGTSKLSPYFAKWDARPGRDAQWREEHAGTLTDLGLSYFAPETPEDALRGEGESIYIPIEKWDTLFEPFPDLDDRTPVVMGVDAAVTGDMFGISIVSRHPVRHEDPSIRMVRYWRPKDFPDKHIDFDIVDKWVRGFCSEHNVVQIAFDIYQLASLAQSWKKDRVAWVKAFDQGSERLIGDSEMHKMAISGRLTHNGDPVLREHIDNASVRLQKGEESKMRIVKKENELKIDLAVASAMAVKRVLELNI